MSIAPGELVEGLRRTRGLRFTDEFFDRGLLDLSLILTLAIEQICRLDGHEIRIVHDTASQMVVIQAVGPEEHAAITNRIRHALEEIAGFLDDDEAPTLENGVVT